MTFFFFILIFFIEGFSIKADQHFLPQEINMTIDLAHPRNIPDFSNVMGGGIDGHIAPGLMNGATHSKVSAMLSSGLKPLTYRLRTELGVESWHWNPHGSWSDATHHQGYWTSSSESNIPITRSYGYRLPRRGNTLDEANNDDYSRLDDGNANTFWKSNPYLTSHYTGEPDCRHQQWILIDFGNSVLVNAARLHWKNPYAKKYRIQYSCGGDLYFGHDRGWHDFPKGKILQSSGDSPILDLGTPHDCWGKSFPIKYVRILMAESSLTAMPGSHDPRDHMGYAMSEVECGFLQSGIFHDQIIHRPDQKQTLIYVSSTDPWHRASDQDKKTEQPGLDFVARSGLGNNQSILWSVPIFYDTPENAVAEVDFLKKRGYLFPSQRVELGEEPDGQRVDPKEVAELYAQVSKKIHHAHPDLSLGGLSLVTIDVNSGDHTYRFDKRPWLYRFFKQLHKKGERNNFQFLTFEWYPFDDLLLPEAPLLINQPARLKQAVTRIFHGGIPKTMPLLISEYGYSVFSGEPEVSISSALLQADTAAQFLLLGGKTSYLYGYEPNALECNYGNSWGNLMMFHQDQKKRDHLEPLPTYYSAQLLTKEWGPTAGGPVTIYPVTAQTVSKKKIPDVTAYFLSAKDQKKQYSSLLFVNKNPHVAYHLTCQWKQAALFQKEFQLPSSWAYYSYSPVQYQWHAQESEGHTLRNQPPAKSPCQVKMKAGSKTTSFAFQKNGDPILLLPSSITVLRSRRIDEYNMESCHFH